MIASYLSETSLHRSPFFSITVSWFSSLEDRYPMRCIPIRPAPTISVLIGWVPTLAHDMYVMVEGRLVGPSNKLPSPMGVENNQHAQGPPHIRLKQPRLPS